VSEDYDGPQIVGLDLHRRRSVMVRTAADGKQLEAVRFSNDREMLARQIAKAGVEPQVVLEATYGWYWAVDVLQAAGARVHLAHPLGVKGFAYRRVKNDVRDAADLADLLRMGRLPEAWIAPAPIRECRELVRHRLKLVNLASGVKAQVHAVLAKCGIAVPMDDLFGPSGMRLLEVAELPAVFRERVDSQLRIIDALETEVARFDTRIKARMYSHPAYAVLQQIPGVGPVFAAVFIAEIGDISRFATPSQLCSWAGLTPRHRESDTTVHRGAITKQGSPLVRWAAVEAVQRAPKSSAMGRTYQRIVDRRGTTAKKVAKIAAARKLLILVYYGMRDGFIRSLAPHAV